MIGSTPASFSILAISQLGGFHSAVDLQRATVQQQSSGEEKLVAEVEFVAQPLPGREMRGLQTSIRVRRAQVYRHHGHGGTVVLSLKLVEGSASVVRAESASGSTV